MLGNFFHAIVPLIASNNRVVCPCLIYVKHNTNCTYLNYNIPSKHFRKNQGFVLQCSLVLFFFSAKISHETLFHMLKILSYLWVLRVNPNVNPYHFYSDQTSLVCIIFHFVDLEKCMVCHFCVCIVDWTTLLLLAFKLLFIIEAMSEF